VAEIGYDHTKDGWLGLSIGSLLYYDITAPSKRPSILAEVIRKELNIVPEASAAVEWKRAASIRTKRVLETEEHLRTWGREVGLPERTVDALVKEGFTNSRILESLAAQPPSELVNLLSLEPKALGVELQTELKKLFA
jgi:hypothetical protein